MKNYLETLIRRRNPKFRFAADIPLRWILELASEKFANVCRGIVRLRGRKVYLGRGVRFFAKNRIRFGSMVQIGDHCYLSGLGTEGITIGNSSSIGAFSRLVTSTTFQNPGAFIRIGSQVGIGEFAYLGGAGGLTIGDGCIIGQYFSCHPENHIYDDTQLEIRHQGTTRQGILIGPGCWIGAKVTICDGVTIGEGCVIAAGAVVTRSMPAHTVIGGVPARVLKSTHISEVLAA